MTQRSAVEQRIEDAGLTLPAVSKPLAAYVPAMRTGNLVFTSGQLPVVDGNIPQTGKLGTEVTTEEGQVHARECVLNALAAIKDIIGDLDKIEKVVKVVGFVSSAADYTDQHLVVNGASEFLAEVLGEAGVHARSAVGMASLPMDVPVEVEMIVQVRD